MEKILKSFAKKVRCGYCAAQVIVGDWIYYWNLFLVYGNTVTTKCTMEFVYRKNHMAANMKVEMLEDLLHMLKSIGPKRSRSASIL